MTEILIPGPEGRIEARYRHGSIDNSNVALILHPDPSRGGTMNTKVVYQVFQCFVENGFSTLRFNFRGVGKSEGSFDGGEGELSDSAVILDWLQNHNPNSKSCWVAGFSFGSWIAMQLLMRRPELDYFISISPPANSRDFSFLAPCPSSGLFIHGDKDEIASYDTAKILSEKLKKQKKINIEFKTVKGADHFYVNHMDNLKIIINEYIAENKKVNS
ncbi:MAG: hypothetical protein CFH21_00510 [Alphaproteobacteria bacterium MarineAlpha5_Bin11]|nr:alpha/beta hydrolase [Pelagibacteraceae bacterium]PPR44105.1 MAG: hypothetical protein CFH21_00510 [Alphaproteobacteria bacterium MarineAlpha5_Bin11]PPR51582.1 MAG: hypothetical protein CFH20_00510 [Alphaproteobacteria bacterium MarineAlpha5_Bin10]|tara:strand:- start:61918 stop:62565 length:648 start_codon:yes stop_codon:yes gene_type:complete